MTNSQRSREIQRVTVMALSTELEAAALNARNLLHVANRELLEDMQTGLTIVAAAERYVADIVSISERLSSIGATQPSGSQALAEKQ